MEGLDPQFEVRKADHIRLALDDRNQASFNDLDQIELRHEALPDLDLADVLLAATVLGEARRTPFFISSMTAGHQGAIDLNLRLARAAASRGWLMGVGSQRKELFSADAHQEWRSLRLQVPTAEWIGNIGLAQLIRSPLQDIQRLVDNLGACAMFVHLNALQEALQVEGTPHFRGGLQRLGELARSLSVPVIVKETGCGFAPETLRRIEETGVHAVDVSGFGGTHWGRIEGGRAPENSKWALAAETFKDWGIGTAQSVRNALEAEVRMPIWASGGVRSGLDAARLLAVGSQAIGLARPLLVPAMESEERLLATMDRIEFELRVAMFCTGSRDLQALRSRGRWAWREHQKN